MPFAVPAKEGPNWSVAANMFCWIPAFAGMSGWN